MKKIIVMTLLSALTASSFFGCAKNNSDSGATPIPQPVYGYQNGQNVCISNCESLNNGMYPGMNNGMYPGMNNGMYPGANTGVNPASLTGLIVQGFASGQTGMSLSASILGDQNMVSQLQTQNLKPFIYYNGALGLTGVLSVAQTIYLKGYISDPFTTCQIPPGQYNLVLQQSGYTQSAGAGAINYIYNSVLGQGPASITLTNVRFILSDTNADGQPDKLNPAFRLSVGNGACADLPVMLF